MAKLLHDHGDRSSDPDRIDVCGNNLLRRMWVVPHYQSTLEDWLWYMAFPLIANIFLIVAALVIPKNPSSALYIVGLAMLLLLMVGIRNAWDMVTFLAVERAHSENVNRNKNVEVREWTSVHSFQGISA